nr:MAG TPA: hypothetical protein [Caudoviricetes sp.]
MIDCPKAGRTALSISCSHSERKRLTTNFRGCCARIPCAQLWGSP